MSYILSCCSIADITKEHFKRRDISYVCFHFFLGDKEYLDDLGESLSLNEFYKAMKDGVVTRTSQVSVGEFIDYFTPFLEQGKDIIHISLSSGISGTFNSACIARDELKEKYPERKIYVVDSRAGATGLGMFMDKLADLRDEGMDIDELNEWVENNKFRLHMWFTTADLTYFVRGGRISKVKGAIGSLLNICPIMNMDAHGEIGQRIKARGKKKAMIEIVNLMKKHADDRENYNDKCYVSHSVCYEDARELADMVEESFPNLKGKVEINEIGTTIGSHSGPGTVALFFFGDARK